MKYRSGDYTIFNGKICKLFEQRQELPLSKYEVQYNVCYDSDERFNFESFTKHPLEDIYCKSFSYYELNNSFFAQTYGLFNDLKVKVFRNFRDLSLVNIITTDKQSKYISLFLDMGNHFMMETPVASLKMIWEERQKSKLDFDFPDGLEKFIVLKSE
jgi:hypothetical protein